MGGDDVIARICQNIVETKIRHRKSVLKGKRYIMSEIFTLGIDVGSTASKCIILKDGKEIVGKSLIDVGAGTSGPSRAIEAVLEDAGLKKEDMAFTLATGYGRTSLMDGIADKQMSELSCHAKGAYFLFPKVHTVIDIGGQDVKVLRVEDGVMTNFQMNTIAPPAKTPAIAPYLLLLLQKRESSITGPNAAPKPAQANDTILNTLLF